MYCQHHVNVSQSTVKDDYCNLQRKRTKVSSIASVMRARFGRTISPLCENMRSTGADEAEMQKNIFK